MCANLTNPEQRIRVAPMWAITYSRSRLEHSTQPTVTKHLTPELTVESKAGIHNTTGSLE
jgi:hypothetical protein